MELITSPLKISIQNPCMQPWEEMDISQNGKYCNHCEKEVIDFTSMSNYELQKWFTTKRENVCGRFEPSQLHNNTQAISTNWKMFSTKILIASCLTFVTGLSANANSKKEGLIVYHQHKNGALQMVVQNLEVFRIDSVIVVKGKINSGMDRLPLVGIKIGVKGSEQSVLSNEKGDFLIEIPALPDQKLILVFSYLGFETKEIEIADHQINPVKVIAYNVIGKVSITGMVTTIQVREPWLKRAWNYIKAKF